NLVKLITWLRANRHPCYALLPAVEYDKKWRSWNLPPPETLNRNGRATERLLCCTRAQVEVNDAGPFTERCRSVFSVGTSSSTPKIPARNLPGVPMSSDRQLLDGKMRRAQFQICSVRDRQKPCLDRGR